MNSTNTQSETNAIIKNAVEEGFKNIFTGPIAEERLMRPDVRRVRMQTNGYGMDILEQVFAKEKGLYRIYGGKKQSRIVKRNPGLKKSTYTGRYYVLKKIRT